MTPEQKALRESVKKAMFTEIADVDDAIDAAIAVALERAAQVADRAVIPMCETSADRIAAAIRALIPASSDAKP